MVLEKLLIILINQFHSQADEGTFPLSHLYVLLGYFDLHLGQVIIIFPLPLGTRNVVLQLEHFKCL